MNESLNSFSIRICDLSLIRINETINLLVYSKAILIFLFYCLDFYELVIIFNIYRFSFYSY